MTNTVHHYSLPLTELETEHLWLRQWQEADFEPFASLSSDKKVMAHFPKLLSREESDALAKRLQAAITQYGWGLWATELKATQEFIGFVGLHIPLIDLPCSPCVEMGWRLDTRYWGKGYATEAAKAAINFGFESLYLQEIVACTALENFRSQRVMQRLGMQAENAVFEHPNVPIGHALRPHYLYRLLRTQWQADIEARSV